MRWIRRLFLDHPYETGETYFQHFRFAAMFSMRIIMVGVCLFVHAVFPCFFNAYARNKLLKFGEILLKRNPPKGESSD